MDDATYLGLSNTSDFLSQSFIPFSKVEHMDKVFEGIVASTKDILSQSSGEIPPAKLQKLEEKLESCRATINECKVDMGLLNCVHHHHLSSKQASSLFLLVR